MRRFFGAITHVEGPSMIPTLKEKGDYVFYEKVSLLFKRFRVGDVIICRSPRNKSQFLCKRIHGVDGDVIRCGRRMVTVPPGAVWVEGDNANDSIDSRHYGPIPNGLLVGKVI
eukprot:jgi/Bigna1/38956/e_gw1.29.71.1